MKVVANHLTKPLVPPSEVNTDLPDELSAIICKMMAKARAERYQNYDDLIGDLDNLLEGKEVGASGFLDTHHVGLDEDELQEVLKELSFAEGLDLEDVEESEEEDSLAAQAAAPQEDAGGPQDPIIFQPEDRTSYHPAQKKRAPNRPAYRRHKSGADRVATVLGIVVAAVVLVGLLAFLIYLMIP
jgi:hypothetical protein